MQQVIPVFDSHASQQLEIVNLLGLMLDPNHTFNSFTASTVEHIKDLDYKLTLTSLPDETEHKHTYNFFRTVDVLHNGNFVCTAKLIDSLSYKVLIRAKTPIPSENISVRLSKPTMPAKQLRKGVYALSFNQSNPFTLVLTTNKLLSYNGTYIEDDEQLQAGAHAFYIVGELYNNVTKENLKNLLFGEGDAKKVLNAIEYQNYNMPKYYIFGENFVATSAFLYSDTIYIHANNIHSTQTDYSGLTPIQYSNSTNIYPVLTEFSLFYNRSYRSMSGNAEIVQIPNLYYCQSTSLGDFIMVGAKRLVRVAHNNVYMELI